MQSNSELAYEDFEVEISFGRGREYPVAVINSPAGEAHETMHFPFDELALENHLLALKNALLQSGGKYRLALSQEEQTVQNFGKALWNALLTGEVRNRYDVSLERANREGKGLRLKLRIQDPKLAALPWEFMYEPRQNEYMCLSRNTSVVRYLELPQPVQPLAVEPPLRILGMAVSPTDLCPLDIAREKQRVEEAIKSLHADGLVELTWIQGQAWRDLQEAMQTGTWHIFYFIGHGGFDCNLDEGLIALADEEGKTQRFRATHLGRLLADHRSLRLVILNSCEGARGSEHDIFSCTASILVQRGIPAVLAMQYDITDRAAIEFSRAFYKALANGLPVDAAVTEARKAVSFAIENTIEWGTPVLYMRSPDGVLFNIQEQKPNDKADRSKQLREKEAKEAQFQPQKAEQLEKERREQEARLAELSVLYSEGIEALGAQDWQTAIKHFNDIFILDASYSDAGAKLKEAEQQLDLAKKKERQQLEELEERLKKQRDEQERIAGEKEKLKGGQRKGKTYNKKVLLAALIVIATLIVIAAVGMNLITLPLTAPGSPAPTQTSPIPAITLTPTPSPIPTPLAPRLKVSQSSYNFGDISAGERDVKAFSISNIGGGKLEWSFITNESWIKLNKMSGSNNESIFITVDSTDLSAGSHRGTIMVTSNGGTEQVTIELNVKSPTSTSTPTPTTPTPTPTTPTPTPTPTPFSKTFGGTGQDNGYSAKQTSDGGYILVGDTGVGNYGDGSSDALLVKTDKYGTKQWEYPFGGTSDDFAYSVAETLDGGYIFVGSTKSIPGPEKEKGWIVKVNKDGIKEWEKGVTGPSPYENSSNGFRSIEQTSDGGFILSGYTTSSGGLANQVQVQAWLVKLDKDGKETWNKGYGSNGGYNYYGRAAKQTSDGNYLMAVSSSHPVSWVAKIDSDGNEIGWKEFRDPENKIHEVAIQDIDPTSDGGYVLTGYQRATFALAWIAKIDSANATTWSKTYGEDNVNIAISSVQQTKDGEYVLAGFRSDGSGKKGLVIKVGTDGSEKDRKVSSETNQNLFQSIEETEDGGYILAGSIGPPEIGKDDVWLVKTDGSVNV